MHLQAEHVIKAVNFFLKPQSFILLGFPQLHWSEIKENFDDELKCFLPSYLIILIKFNKFSHLLEKRANFLFYTQFKNSK